ncbi:MAG: PIN domain-containing protein [Candidatus Tectomicrobia bacterium]|nr:PIN domain-containing protein [Candidatus Tectomicrobia bacterium]
MSMKKVVFDTTILVSGLCSNQGASYRLLEMALSRRENFQLIISPALFFEYETVLKHPDQVAIHRLRPEEIETFLRVLLFVANPLYPSFTWRALLADPLDIPLADLVIAAKVEYLVATNPPHFTSINLAAFGCSVVRPGTFLSSLLAEEEPL